MTHQIQRSVIEFVCSTKGIKIVFNLVKVLTVLPCLVLVFFCCLT